MLGIHVSEGKAEGWFGRGKKSVIMSIVILVVLIVGIAFGIFAAVSARGDTNINPPNAPVTPVVPITPMPTPSTAITPTPTPTQTQTPTPTRVPFTAPPDQIAISVQEFIAGARAGKYNLGEWITVSATYESHYRDPKITMYFFFGPQVDGGYLIVDGNLTRAEVIPFGKLSKGDRVTIRGLYEGFMTIDGKEGGVLEYCDIIK